MTRESIPPKVKQTLRAEVGFGCPVPGCGNPYLEYHHFDPPVAERANNEPKGMIALCAQHHKKADGGAYTVEQLHALKKNRAHAETVKGSLDWLRRDLVAVVGGSFYYETPKVVVIDGVEVISVKRDDQGYFRLSVNLLSLEAEDRIAIDMNSWSSIGEPHDLRCPPQGKELEVKYSNGDYLYLRFSEFGSAEEAVKKYGQEGFFKKKIISYPLTVLEVNLEIGGTNINISPSGQTYDWLTVVVTAIRCGTGVNIADTGRHWKNQKPAA